MRATTTTEKTVFTIRQVEGGIELLDDGILWDTYETISDTREAVKRQRTETEWNILALQDEVEDARDFLRVIDDVLERGDLA